MKPRLYFDTSVFGGVFDKDFEEISTILFEKVRLGQIICVYSDLSESEISFAPQRVIDHFKSLPKQFLEYVELTEDTIELANKYIEEKVVGETSLDDCRHIALATIHKTDYLVSWNFKHIVNVFRIRGYNAVNLKNGYAQLDIRSPKEIVHNEN
jgi:hypothetical protein